MEKELSIKDLASFQKAADERKDLKVASRSIARNGLNNSAIDDSVLHSMPTIFSIDVDAGDITNQKKSGRCWMFAGLNVLRVGIMKNLNLKTFEYSQAYLQFYDKLEKFNFALEKAALLANEPIDSRLNVFLLDTVLGDGGHWAMFVNLVKKYGLVPNYVMPDNAVNCNTAELNDLLNKILAKDVKIIRDLVNNGKETEIASTKEKMLSEVYGVLGATLGFPPKEFIFEYKDKDGKFHHVNEPITPLEWYQKTCPNLDEYMPLCHGPLTGFVDYQKYTTPWVNNVIGGEGVTIFNVPLDEMKKAIVESLKAGEVVWFGADVLTQSLRKEGILADKLFKVDELLGIDISSDKGSRMDYRTSFCNHAMTFTGVNLVDGKPNRWKVENSWGKDVGDGGFFVMDEDWFDDYVYEIFVKKDKVSPESVKKYEESQPIEVSPFSVMWKQFD